MRCVHAKNEEKLYRLVLFDLVGWTLESLFTLIGRLYLQLSTLFFRDSEFMQEISILFGRTFPFKKIQTIWENSPAQLCQKGGAFNLLQNLNDLGNNVQYNSSQASSMQLV